MIVIVLFQSYYYIFFLVILRTHFIHIIHLVSCLVHCHILVMLGSTSANPAATLISSRETSRSSSCAHELFSFLLTCGYILIRYNHSLPSSWKYGLTRTHCSL